MGSNRRRCDRLDPQCGGKGVRSPIDTESDRKGTPKTHVAASLRVAVRGTTPATGPHVQNTSANLQSSIIANNKFDSCNSGGFLSDLTGLNATITGANNLIMGSTVAPAGSLTADPLLEALTDNGGPTPTRKLGSDSPAIAHGNNSAGLTFDQRGPGHARTYAGTTDVGAYQTGDSPFNSRFE